MFNDWRTIRTLAPRWLPNTITLGIYLNHIDQEIRPNAPMAKGRHPQMKLWGGK
jgi:hypothetical protein